MDRISAQFGLYYLLPTVQTMLSCTVQPLKSTCAFHSDEIDKSRNVGTFAYAWDRGWGAGVSTSKKYLYYIIV